MFAKPSCWSGWNPLKDVIAWCIPLTENNMVGAMNTFWLFPLTSLKIVFASNHIKIKEILIYLQVLLFFGRKCFPNIWWKSRPPLTRGDRPFAVSMQYLVFLATISTYDYIFLSSKLRCTWVGFEHWGKILLYFHLVINSSKNICHRILYIL